MPPFKRNVAKTISENSEQVFFPVELPCKFFQQTEIHRSF